MLINAVFIEVSLCFAIAENCRKLQKIKGITSSKTSSKILIYLDNSRHKKKTAHCERSRSYSDA